MAKPTADSFCRILLFFFNLHYESAGPSACTVPTPPMSGRHATIGASFCHSTTGVYTSCVTVSTPVSARLESTDEPAQPLAVALLGSGEAWLLARSLEPRLATPASTATPTSTAATIATIATSPKPAGAAESSARAGAATKLEISDRREEDAMDVYEAAKPAASIELSAENETYLHDPVFVRRDAGPCKTECGAL